MCSLEEEHKNGSGSGSIPDTTLEKWHGNSGFKKYQFPK
jgi:hypothetical protein